MPGNYSTGCGCVALSLSILIGAPLALIGIRNFNIRRANPAPKKVTLKDVVTTQPENPLWIEASGVPVDGSYAKVPGLDFGYMVLLDPEHKVAIFVALGTAPPLPVNTGEPLVVRGIIEKVPEGLPFSANNLPPDVKVTPLMIGKDQTPPGWFASWGLIMISAAMLAATTTALQRARGKH